MTGFRIAKGCAQEYFGITPDLTTMGKVIGGGLPVGAYGGRKDIMEMVAPAGPMYQAGTLSGEWCWQSRLLSDQRLTQRVTPVGACARPLMPPPPRKPSGHGCCNH